MWHAWIPAPEDAAFEVLQSLSFNQAVEEALNAPSPSVAKPPVVPVPSAPPHDGAAPFSGAPDEAQVSGQTAEGEGDDTDEEGAAAALMRAHASGRPEPGEAGAGSRSERGEEEGVGGGEDGVEEGHGRVGVRRGVSGGTAAARGIVIREFLQAHPSQVTFTGLVKLHEVVREREVGVFFRNNHFSTLFRTQGQLYTLITDEGFRDVHDAVWEKLDAVDGDVQYVDSEFRLRREPDAPGAVAARTQEQADVQLARMLQHEEQEAEAARRAHDDARARDNRQQPRNHGQPSCVVA
jgi:hypothetical protein